MRPLCRAGGAVRRGAMRMVPAGRRDWVVAIWAEAAEVPPGLPRLAWRAGGVRLMVREALMRRRIRIAIVFAVGAALAARAAWSGSPAYLATSNERAEVIVLVLVLAVLPVLARRLFGPADRSRTARALRVCAYAAILALIPARNVLGQILDVRPRAGLDLRVYRLVDQGARDDGILFLAIVVLYAAAILWLTSKRSRLAPASLAAGIRAGIAAGVVVSAVAPLGLSKSATNPWLPGSEIDPLVLLAWAMTLLAPVRAAYVAHQRAPAPVRPPPMTGANARQCIAAGVLANLVTALLVAVLGTGTTALMIKATWLRNWLYGGQHQLYGVDGLRSLLHGDLPAIAYSHELTASVDATTLLVICIAFPLLALAVTAMSALDLGEPATRLDNPPPDDGGPPGPGPAQPPPPTGGARLPGLARDTGPAGLLSRHQPGPDIRKERLPVG